MNCLENIRTELQRVLDLPGTAGYKWDKFGSLCFSWGIDPFEALKEIQASGCLSPEKSPVFSCVGCSKGFATQNALNAHRGKCGKKRNEQFSK